MGSGDRIALNKNSCGKEVGDGRGGAGWEQMVEAEQLRWFYFIVQVKSHGTSG